MKTSARVAVLLSAGLLASAWPERAAEMPAVSLVRLPSGGIQPQAVVDGRGGVHVLYFMGDPAHGDLFYARLDSSNRFSAPIRVNSVAGSAMATGTMRGGHLAVGRNGRIYVAWHGSSAATPKAPGNETPVLVTRLDDLGAAFERERNVVERKVTGLDGGTVAADASGNVYVAWHAFEPGLRGEADRRVWVARSRDDGRTFAMETPASDASTGACGCCAVGLMADRRGTLYGLYRSAADSTHRDTYLLTSRDRGQTFSSDKLQEWNVGACPMSSFSLADTASGVLAAWETNGQVQWTRVDAATGRRSAMVEAPGASQNRKHPVLAANDRGESMLVWTEGTGWNKGGGVAWQIFGRDGRPAGEFGRAPGVPTWSLAAGVARPAGGFVILY
jgi:hypothetical protein